MNVGTDEVHDTLPPDEAFEALLRTLAEHHPEAELSLIGSAFEFASRAHDGQTRKTNDPYITHPIAVARILAELQMDEATIAAGLLHDVVEDTGVTADDIAERFGPEIAALVDGVTKLKSVGRDVFSGEALTPDGSSGGSEVPKRKRDVAKRAANLRKILLAMARDLRVVVIKLADRLHNMRTLWAMEESDQRRVANETLQVFAPLAHRVGIWQIKWELEDLAFRYAEPEQYRRIAAQVAQTRAERQGEVDEAVRLLRERLAQDELPDAHITGRPKHLYSIYQKMLHQDLDFKDIYDLVALRVIVHSRAQCYQALGSISGLWTPMPGMYTDFIAQGKSNMYQSLHLKVIGPQGKPVEVQIRTWEMHRTAEFGVAAHWAYKEQGDGGKASDQFDRKMSFLRQQLFDWQADAPDSGTFLRQVVEDLFSDQIFVFTPRGDVFDLPAGATPIDFAYRIHSDVGNHAIGARVSGRFVPLAHTLKNGDVVEILTRTGSTPGRDWLPLAKTSHAKSKIKAYFRKVQYEEHLEAGRALLVREAEKAGLEPARYRDEAVREIAKGLNVNTEADVYSGLGAGTIAITTVLSRLAPEQPQERGLVVGRGKSDESRMRVSAASVDNVSFRRSRCCLPIPGDEIVGYVTRGRGMALHRVECPNAQRSMVHEPERIMPVEYFGGTGQVYSVHLCVQAADRTGLLADVGAIFGDMRTNITRISTQSHRDHTATLDLAVELRDCEHLSRLQAALQRMPDVIAITRPVAGRAD